MRKKLLACNWKMNKTLNEVQEFFLSLNGKLTNEENLDLLICPSSIYLRETVLLSSDLPLKIGAQDVSQFIKGAYTGDNAAFMLKSLGLDFAIVGHSERRMYFNESNDVINTKIQLLQQEEITSILCIGESLEEREDNKTLEVIKTQLDECLYEVPVTIDEKIIIAYEPIWAIGTGKTATPALAQEVHAFIRNWLVEKYGKQIADSTQILYGGSVKPANIEELLSQDDIDGGLVGGASLEIDSLIEMFNIAKEL